MGSDQHPDTARMAAALRAAAAYRPDPERPPVVLSLPFDGPWLAVNSPARRIPSHGTHFLGQTYAIDFVAVDARGRTASVRDWRTVLATEPAERFVGYDAPILAPADGWVALAHDGEPDHEARRSVVTVIPYLFTQAGRLRRGLSAVTGNHVILALAEGGPYVVLAHLRPGSLRVAAGDRVMAGQQLATCGNSGNTTQPHVHIHVMDSTDILEARGLPMAFRDYLAWPQRGKGEPTLVSQGVPGHRQRVEAASTR